MGLLTTIAAATEKIIPPLPVPTQPVVPAKKILPCSKCSFPIFWLSIYRDGILRCCECDPPPLPSLVARKVYASDAEQDLRGPAPGSRSSEKPVPVYSDEYIALHFPPWPDWNKKPGAWRALQREQQEIEEAAAEFELLADDPDSSGEASSEASSDDSEQPRRAPRARGRLPPDPQPHKEPNPGCLRDYRGKGGSCTHHLAGQKANPGDRVACSKCGKFVGYKREEKKSGNQQQQDAIAG